MAAGRSGVFQGISEETIVQGLCLQIVNFHFAVSVYRYDLFFSNGVAVCYGCEVGIFLQIDPETPLVHFGGETDGDILDLIHNRGFYFEGKDLSASGGCLLLLNKKLISAGRC